MAITGDLHFAFDVQGYLHLRTALTPAEITEYTQWMNEVEQADLQALNASNAHGMKPLMNRPVSRVFDADTRFARFLDHPTVEPFLVEFLGADYRHIDNELYYTYPGYSGGGWHRGVRAHPTGHVVDGKFICPMVKVFYCMSDVGHNEGEFEVVPGSHRAQFDIDCKGRTDLPAQHIFNDVQTGDIIIFNEALIHNGRPNPSSKTRKTIIMNFGRSDAGPWPGYTPAPQTLETVKPRQREILSNTSPVWSEPTL